MAKALGLNPKKFGSWLIINKNHGKSCYQILLKVCMVKDLAREELIN